MSFRNLILLLSIFLLFISCKNDGSSNNVSNSSATKLFSEISVDQSTVTFNNQITESPEINHFRYGYLYNGGGVGVGDINNDNLPDLYFTSTQGFDKLYLNKGDFKFEDISNAAGIAKYPGYKTGISFIDINGDGWLDIYVCRSGWLSVKDRENLLFINNKNGTFVESAEKFGLNDNSQSIQSVFFDYDKDGDLDMYLVNHPKTFNQSLDQMINNVNNPNKGDSDKFYINNGDNTFSDISEKAGILNYTFSLGLVAGDLNNDGWIDVYSTSDFQPRDHYYVNNGDGTFTESLEKYFPHCSYFSMGVDLVDINGDQNLDLFVGEMLSEENSRQKTNMASMDMDFFDQMTKNGMYFQYMRNSFHLNNGNGHFSDIAHYSGIDKTDWSWSSLFGDYDHDGDNDLLVVNGWLNDTQDKDFSKNFEKLVNTYKQDLKFEQTQEIIKSTPLQNYAFEYDKDLKFNKVSEEWGFDLMGFSNGMAYGDLDNDGDIDVVLNNMNSPASIYKNNTNNDGYLKIKLTGPKNNTIGLNTKLSLETDNGTQYKEFQTTRGFQSSCEPFVHFGFKESNSKLNLNVVWPDGKSQKLNNLKPGSITVKYDDASAKPETKKLQDQLLSDQSDKLIDFKHQEINFDDYKVQVLLPHKLSQLGPALAKTDVNNDGLEDVFIGGAHGQSAKLFAQNKNGTFSEINNPVFTKDKDFEDVDAVFFDANGDKYKDLYVVSGSYEFEANHPLLEDRLYINNGSGVYKRNTTMIPSAKNNGRCVDAVDFDNDGDEDLFVGSGVQHGKYPLSENSYLLINEGNSFVDKTTTFAAACQNVGMVTDVKWTDFDNDQDQDLIIVGEWTNLLFFENQNSTLVQNIEVLNKEYIGWWNTIEELDIDNDGDMDYLFGNLGENYKYKASDDHPFEMFSGDFDSNGTQDIVLSYVNKETLFPVRGLQCSSEQIPEIKNKINTYEVFGNSDVYQVYGDALDDAIHFKANCFKSLILINNNGEFDVKELNFQCQTFPIQDFETLDIDEDGDLDVIAAGNWYMSEIETPRADNGIGVVLNNLGDGNFQTLSWEESGFFAPHDVRALSSVLNAEGNPIIFVGNNNAKLQSYVLDK